MHKYICIYKEQNECFVGSCRIRTSMVSDIVQTALQTCYCDLNIPDMTSQATPHRNWISTAGWLVCWLAGCLHGWLTRFPACRLGGWLADQLIWWLLAAWLAGLAAWSGGKLSSAAATRGWPPGWLDPPPASGPVYVNACYNIWRKSIQSYLRVF